MDCWWKRDSARVLPMSSGILERGRDQEKRSTQAGPVNSEGFRLMLTSTYEGFDALTQASGVQ